MNTASLIHDRWPLASMLARCNISVPGKGKFCSPFRPDQTASCEVYENTIKDWSTGETFDSIRVFAESKGIPNKDAFKLLAEELPNRSFKSKKAVTKNAPATPTIPPLHYCPKKAHALADLRGISRYGIDLAATTIGTLGFGEVLGHDCWVLTDGLHIAEARRMDGQKFPAVGTLGERKSHTLRGSSKFWPIGITPQHGTKALAALPIVMVEGGPDYLAACDVAWYSPNPYQPVAMLGSSSLIHADAPPLLKGREVLILAHPDEAGVNAAKKWCNQLRKANAIPAVKKLSGGDLNDLVKRDGAEAVAIGLLK